MIALFTCTGPATNDIGPFLGSEDERRPVAEAIVDTVGPEVAVQLVISFLKNRNPQSLLLRFWKVAAASWTISE